MTGLKIEHFTADDKLIPVFQELPQKIYQPPPSPKPVDSNCLYWLAMNDGLPVARLSTQTADDLYDTEGLSGMIGHYEALSLEAGITLLNEAKLWLKKKGVQRVLGPMNGSTWERYRLALLLEDAASFFLSEPRNPPDYPEHFSEAGFSPVDLYESRITDELTCQESKCQRFGKKIEKMAVEVRPIELSEYDKVLEEVFALSAQAFSQNKFYRDIDFTRFKALYDPIKPILDPDFVRLAYDQIGKVIGVALAFPDLYSVKDGTPQQLVFKTLAVDQKVRGIGLGVYMFDLIHLAAHQKGYKKVIHALMHSDNVSLKLSRVRYNSSLLRRYALYQWLPE